MTQVLLAPLRRAGADELAAFFRDVDAVDLVTEVARTPDAELEPLVDRDEVRRAAVVGILARLGEYAVAERLATVSGVVRFELTRGGTVREVHAVRFDHGVIAVLDEANSRSTPADVVLRTSALRFVRIVSGEADPALDYLAGRRSGSGDARLALEIGALFCIPGQEAVAVDPSALDPVDVSAALVHATRDHLREVMDGGFRAVVLDEIFTRLPSYVDARRARGSRLTVGFRLTRRGEVAERYVVCVTGGTATVLEGAEAEAVRDRDATLTIAGEDFLRLATGHLTAVSGVMRGQLKVRGDRGKALAFAGLVDFPKPPKG